MDRWWDENAIDLVLSGGSVYKASKKYGIPSNALKYRIENGDPKKPGPKAKIEAEKRKNQLKIEAGKRKERLFAQEELAKIGRLSR